ncbi:hypothetical protein K2D_28060 [Enterococcus hirae]|nr:DUF896 domain-containing protein [Enterococcus hirae]GMB99710.1 hypothetical protein K2D_28060 [Enterococcus hirae]
MLSPEKITRINELAQKKKTEGLTADHNKKTISFSYTHIQLPPTL